MIYGPGFLNIQYVFDTLLYLIALLYYSASLFERGSPHFLECPQPAARPRWTHPSRAALLHKRWRRRCPRSTPIIQLIHQTYLSFIHVSLEQTILLR